jgi:hypothetical protein
MAPQVQVPMLDIPKRKVEMLLVKGYTPRECNYKECNPNLLRQKYNQVYHHQLHPYIWQLASQQHLVLDLSKTYHLREIT